MRKALLLVALAATTLDAARVYPNPWRGDRDRGLPVRFDGLTDHSEVRVFSTAGRWSRTLCYDCGQAAWDLRNDAGQPVSSGIYLYMIRDPFGHRRVGVVSIVR